MAARKPGVIALLDVDGTLTAPRKVSISPRAKNISCAWLFCYDFNSKIYQMQQFDMAIIKCITAPLLNKTRNLSLFF